MKLSQKVDRLEEVMSKHLEESGEIRQDIKWLKRLGYWLAGSPVAMEVIKHVWR